jgi:hypothetical protein
MDANVSLGALALSRKPRSRPLGFAQAGILSLPNELLAAVFSEGRNLVGLYAMRPFPVLCSHVSQKWRDVAINTAILWTSLYLHATLCDELLTMHLERNRVLPFDIRVNLPDNTQVLWKIKNHLHKVIPYVDRWGSFSVIASHGPFVLDILLHLSELHAHRLQYFEVIADNPPVFLSSNADLQIFRLGASALTSVHLEGVQLSSCWPPLGAVVALHLDFGQFSMAAETFIQALREIDALKELTLLHHYFIFPPRTSSLSLAIQFNIPSLRYFKVSFGTETTEYLTRFWEIFSMPSLESLTLICNSMAHIPAFVSSSHSPLKYPALHTLILYGTWFPFDSAADLLSVLPSITHLSVVWCDPSPVLNALLGGRGLHLQTISISDIEPDILDILGDLIISRIDARRPLRRIKIKSFAFDDIPQARLDWLREHVEVEEYNME